MQNPTLDDEVGYEVEHEVEPEEPVKISIG
jgi:hypothetical protein